MSTNTNATRYAADIANHTIVWWLNGANAPQALDEASIEHIEGLLRKDFREGELCVTGDDGETDFRGWWQLDVDDEPRIVTAEQAVKDIVEALLASDTLLETIYNQVCAGTLEHKGNSMFELTPDSE